ncbi:hypothetical protein HPB47_021860 [Ixodes persulcatus]|uniref:Uncharacterized protein n=1 Tax=Ixodes persulcatus TaxID=34615 RepID=A0AC60QBJ0_IXOPE|nr:hypothetical protein HPB47_021860 [Ixodes persulcatus]
MDRRTCRSSRRGPDCHSRGLQRSTQDWGNSNSTRKGRQIKHAMKTVGLTLRNEPGTKTRIGMHSRQKDSTPDLSWATASLVLDWSTWRDNLDSDHFPVEMKIHHGQRNSGKEQRPVVKWDRFRELLETEDSQDIEDCIRTALSEAKTKVLVKPGAPTPDNHLLNLWASRLQALQRYRKNRTLHLKIKLKRAAAKARQYSEQLGRESARLRNAAQNLALKLNISEEEMAIRAGELFFPQEEDSANQRPVAMNTRTPEEEGMEDPLNMGELIEAIYTAKTGSAPGPDGITGRTITKIKKVATELRIRGTDLHITWLPGHSKIPGNERAHRAAAEEIFHGSATGPTSHSETNNTVDPEEQAELARQARKAYLRGLLPSQEDNIPTSYTRWEAVRVRRIRTGTAFTPAKQASFGLVDLEGSRCKACAGNNTATLRHLLWDCAGLERLRKKAIHCLREEERPATLEEWSRPQGTPQHRKAILDSLMSYIRETGTHHHI